VSGTRRQVTLRCATWMKLALRQTLKCRHCTRYRVFSLGPEQEQIFALVFQPREHAHRPRRCAPATISAHPSASFAAEHEAPDRKFAFLRLARSYFEVPGIATTSLGFQPRASETRSFKRTFNFPRDETSKPDGSNLPSPHRHSFGHVGSAHALGPTVFVRQTQRNITSRRSFHLPRGRLGVIPWRDIEGSLT
jgi:hypothetical protein